MITTIEADTLTFNYNLYSNEDREGGLSARQTSQMSQHSELSFLHDKRHNTNLNNNNKRQKTTNVIEIFQVRTTNVKNVTKWAHQVITMFSEQLALVYLSPVG